MEVIADFTADWGEQLRGELAAAGYPVEAGEDPDRVSIKYFNIRSRLIPAQPRKVLVSHEFTCPPHLISVLESLKQKIAAGDDITPHQSTRLLDAEFNDYLLNDWGIHHFHLSVEPHPKIAGFVARTGPLLFARLTSDEAFLIDVVEHDGWSEQRLVTIMHSNWAESIEGYRLKDVKGVEMMPSDSEIGLLRKAGVNTTIEVAKGVVYAPPGGGYTTSRVSVNVVLAVNRYLARVKKLEGYVRHNAEEIIEAIHSSGLETDSPPHFRLAIGKNGAYAVEKRSRTAFFVGEL